MKALKFSITCLAMSVLATTGFAMQTAEDQAQAITEAADVQAPVLSEAVVEREAAESEMPEPETVETGSAEAATEDQPGDAVGETEEISIMDMPLNGSSIETFSAGLEEVDKKATEEEYRKLMSALDFLLFYDVSARRDKARLYSRLNGKTPNQIIKKVAENRSGR